jgi:hypothetical protein
MQNVRPLGFDQRRETGQEPHAVSMIRPEVENRNVGLFEVRAQGSTVLHLFAQARHSEIDSSILEKATKGQEVQFRSAGGKGIDQMEDFHGVMSARGLR